MNAFENDKIDFTYTGSDNDVDKDTLMQNYEPMDFLDWVCDYHRYRIGNPSKKLKIANLGSGKVQHYITKDDIEITNFDHVISGMDVMDELFNTAQNQFDCVSSTRLFEHIPIADMTELLYACYSVLKPGGRIFIAVPDNDYMSKLFENLNGDDWFQRYNILNSITYHSVQDKNGVLLDSHKTVWNSSILHGFLSYEDNFNEINTISPMKISNQRCYIVGIGRKAL